jgi:hypothetical protein
MKDAVALGSKNTVKHIYTLEIIFIKGVQPSHCKPDYEHIIRKSQRLQLFN